VQVAGVTCTSDLLCADCWGILAGRPWPGPGAPPQVSAPCIAQLLGSQLSDNGAGSPHCKRKKCKRAVRPLHLSPSCTSSPEAVVGARGVTRL